METALDTSAILEWLRGMKEAWAEDSPAWMAYNATEQEIRKGSFDATRTRREREAAEQDRMDNLVERQSTTSYNGFTYEAWLVKRKWQWRIVGTSVFVTVSNYDGYDWYTIHCEVDENRIHDLGYSTLHQALEAAFNHWMEKHNPLGFPGPL